MDRKTLRELGLIAVGGALLAGREFESMVRDFLKDSGASRSEGERFLRRLRKSVQSKRSEMAHGALNIVAELAGLELVSKKDYARLERRLAALEKNRAVRKERGGSLKAGKKNG